MSVFKKASVFALFAMLFFSFYKLAISGGELSLLSVAPLFLLLLILTVWKPAIVFFIILFFSIFEVLSDVIGSNYLFFTIALIFFALLVLLIESVILRNKLLFAKEMLPVFLLLAFGVFSFFFAVDFKEGSIRVARLSSCFILFFIAYNSVRKKKDLYFTLLTIITAGIMLGISSFMFSEEMAKDGIYRLSAYNFSANTLGISCAAFIPLCLGVKKAASNRALKLTMLAAVALMLSVVYFSASRGAFISAIAGILLVLFRRLLSLKVFVLFIMAALVIFPFLPQYHLERITDLPGLDSGVYATKGAPDISTENRMRTLADGFLNVFGRNPVLGVGISNYVYFSWERYPSHNTYLGIAGELGLLGLTLFLWIIAQAFFAIRKSKAMAAEASDESMRWLAEGIEISLIILCIGAFTVNFEYVKFFWIIIILAAISKNVSAGNEA